jgi:UDP-N-acetylmuramate--alanine ligase
MMPELSTLLGQAELRIHMIGIGGVGMAGLARLLQQRGHWVQGSEQTASRLVDWLQSGGIRVHMGHDADLLDAELDLVIRTTAVPLDHPECKRASEMDLPLYRRGEVFPAFLRAFKAIAVTGTHGKTTTTAMIVHLLRNCGIKTGYFVGGESAQLGAIADIGDGEHMIVEADESDGTLVHYRPEIAVVTNIEFDHMEHFENEAEMLDCFREFLSGCAQVIYCRDDAQATKLCGPMAGALSYGFSEEAELRLDAYSPAGLGCRVTLEGEETSLPFAGRHNALNALASIALGRALECGMGMEVFSGFEPVDRRFQVVSRTEKVTVVSDYAHHPTEIRATLDIARGLGARRIIGIFQPHRYSRTRLLGPLFPPAFEGLDHLVLCPVYAASEQPVAGGTHRDMGRMLIQHGQTACTIVEGLDEAWEQALRQLDGEGLLLILGAGDVVDLVKEAIRTFG